MWRSDDFSMLWLRDGIVLAHTHKACVVETEDQAGFETEQGPGAEGRRCSFSTTDVAAVSAADIRSHSSKAMLKTTTADRVPGSNNCCGPRLRPKLTIADCASGLGPKSTTVDRASGSKQRPRALPKRSDNCRVTAEARSYNQLSPWETEEEIANAWI